MSLILYFLFLASAVCSGSPISPRILGGSDADIKDFPYIVSVELIGHQCGAVIINANWVLTDAWCYEAPVDVSKFTVRAGSAMLGNGLSHNVTEWKYHPLSDTFNSEYDFALIQVEPAFEFGENVAPVALPAQGQETPQGAEALISGWGEVDGSDDATINQLQFGSIAVLGETECAESLGSDYAESKLCAQDPNGVVAHCWYDEGGPLVVDGTLFGIALWPSYCNNPLKVGIYSRVASVRDWIDVTVSVTGTTTPWTTVAQT